MKFGLFLILLISTILGYSQSDTNYLTIISWNIQNFGKSKSISEIEYISKKVKSCDILAIQEVSTSEFGPQAVAKLDECLDRTGYKWDYVISDKTTGEGSEKYAFLYKTSRVRTRGLSRLENSLSDSLDREPFLCIFEFNSTDYYLFNLHLVPTDKFPEREVLYLDTLNSIYKNRRIVIMGDFNLSCSHKSFNELKSLGFNPVFVGQKTSLKMKESDDPLNKEYDNFIVSKNIKIGQYGIIPFYSDFTSIKEARLISDHCPIQLKIK